jgi:hypothetical protein
MATEISDVQSDHLHSLRVNELELVSGGFFSTIQPEPVSIEPLKGFNPIDLPVGVHPITPLRRRSINQLDG